MKKLLIFGQNKAEIEKVAKDIGFEIVEKEPDIVASYGGDGTFMGTENMFPGIPKFPLKNSRICKLGFDLPNEEILKRIWAGEYRIDEEMKIEASANGEKVVGLNEIIVHNSDPRRAIRYTLSIGGKKITNEIIGDGVAISTPIGSTGYYRSITDSFFQVGIGIAFNNSTEQADHMVVKEDSQILIKILRSPAMIYADNIAKEIILGDGDEVSVRKAKEAARIIRLLAT